MSKLVMLTNSPGEISGWFLPLARIIREAYPQLEIIAVLLPCQYASGTEIKVLSESKIFFKVVDRKELFRFLLSPKIKGEKVLILQLGGDPYWGTLFKKRLKGKLFVYSDSLVHTNKWADIVLLADPRFSKGKKNEIVVGNLILDSVDTNISVDGSSIAFLPGSRPYGLKLVFPLMLETAEKLRKIIDNPIKFIISPFIPLETLNSYIPNSFKIEQDKIISKLGNTYYLEHGTTWEWARDIRLAVNIPGTNTLQLAVLGIPQITILPLQWAEYIPLEGILEWISRIPIIGKKIKRTVVYKLATEIKFIALPNIISKRKITEELMGIITPEILRDKILELLNNKQFLDNMTNDLKTIKFLGGAGRNIAKLVGDELL
ncbi:MAG: hypothetical protein N2380_02850 [bacterium]|nr:hypothetical protein [bacterium]